MTPTPVDRRLLAGLVDVARRLSGDRTTPPVVLSDRPDGVVVRVAGVVVKAHPPGTESGELRMRVRLAAGLDGLLLPPLLAEPESVGDRWVTAWPAGEPVDPDSPEAAPWEPAGRLLARLHRAPLPGGVPPAGAPARVLRARDRLAAQAADHPAAGPVFAAFAGLPGWAYGSGRPSGRRPRALIHGDWHLGQIVRIPSDGWLLVDVDDLGYGDPAWDLARPAAWYATGMMTPAAWRGFVDAYRSEGGPALPPYGDPWPALDAVARVLVVQTAALAVVEAARERRDLDEVEQAIVDTCGRVADEVAGRTYTRT